MEIPLRKGGPRRRPLAHHARGHYPQTRLRPRRQRTYRQRLPRSPAIHPRPLCDDVRRAPVDHPPICGLFHRRGIQRLLPPQPCRRAKGALGRLRPSHPPRLRQRPSASDRRRRQGGGRDRQRRGHEAVVRRHSVGRNERQHDHERGGSSDHGLLHRRGRGAGGASDRAFGNDPERHFKRVRGPQHLHLPARALDADRQRHYRLHLARDAPVQLHLDLGLSYARGGCDRGPGACLYPCRRDGICPRRRRAGPRDRRLRPAALVLLRHRHEPVHGGRQAARGAYAVGPDHDRSRRNHRKVEAASHPLPDFGRVADRAGPLQ